MSFTWGQRSKIREEGFQAGIDSIMEREVAVSEKERTQATRSIELEVRAERIAALNNNHDELAILTNQAKLELAQASFELEKSRFEMTKEQVANDALLLNKKLAEKDREWQVKFDTEAARAKAAYSNDSVAMVEQLMRANADSLSKDIIISSKDQEIARLDELLKVTMAKLTQIDIKGLSIHVENERSKKEDKE